MPKLDEERLQAPTGVDLGDLILEMLSRGGAQDWVSVLIEGNDTVVRLWSPPPLPPAPQRSA